MISESVADYLTEILRLEEAGEPASTSELATRLQVARPSVSGMLRRLADDGLVTYAPDQGAHLTARGRRRARAMLRRHRLVETFLVNALAMPPEQVHAEAHRWEHALSDDAVDRLDRWLGNPAADPHGTPIPDGQAADRAHAGLGALDVGTPARVSRVASRDADHAAYLASLGLRRGATVTITERRPFAGPVTLDVDGRRCVVGPEVTEYVTIHEERP
ncbi:MAG: metal-dependent transcriptional regulator [Candidatus Krumholzibacteriia bacterium]